MASPSLNQEKLGITGDEQLLNVETLGSFHALDASMSAGGFILECRNGCQFRLSAKAKFVLEMRWAGLSFEAIAAALQTEGLATASANEVHKYYDRLFETIKQGKNAYRGVPDGYSLRFSLIPYAAVARTARVLTWVYSPISGVLLLAVTAVGHALFFHRGFPIPKQGFDGIEFGIAYGLFLVSLLMHEFGHASACLRYGAKPGAIGFILYLTFPALYSDVSSAWKIRRWQRVVVDLAGSYLQLVVSAIYAILFLTYRWEPYGIAVLMITGTTLFNLNPLFKFDGYWVVSDALGVPNLGKHSRAIVMGLVRSIFRGSVTTPQSFTSTSRSVAAGLAVYGTLAIVAWGYFSVRLLESIPAMLFGAWTIFRASVLAGRISPASSLQLLFTVMGIYFTAVFLAKMAKQLLKWLVSRLASSRVLAGVRGKSI